MRNPSEYSTTSFAGFHVMVVDAGTEITDERTGKKETVTDGCVVRKGSVFWCTQPMLDMLKCFRQVRKDGRGRRLFS